MNREPPFRFVDEQRRGPFRLWVHEHRFEERDGGTQCLDTVRYQLRGGPVAPLIDRLWVRRDVAGIFAFRQSRLRERFGPTEARAGADAPPDADTPTRR